MRRLGALLWLASACSFPHGSSMTTPDDAPIADTRIDDSPRPGDAAIDGKPADASLDAFVLTCPSGYVTLSGAPSKYKIFGYSSNSSQDQSRSFEDARALCAGEGTHLAIADSAAEATALGNAIPVNSFSRYFWDGVTDAVTENTWRTVLNTNPSYLPWGQGQPNGGTDDNCGLMATNGVLYDWACGADYPFACECE